MFTGYYRWPMGLLRIKTDMMGVRAIEFASDSDNTEIKDQSDVHGYELYTEVCHQLDLYFAGKLDQFDLPLKPVGTDFQKKVWRMLLTIPFGETKTYKDIAELTGNSKGYRAVGTANGQNPIAIVVPCHRVIAADGSPGGYAAGVDIKKWLLDHEKQHYNKKDK